MELPYLSTELTRHIPHHNGGGVVLDLACGDGKYREAFEDGGYEWVGLDIESQDASVWGDAHRLPLPDNSVDLVLGAFALEHFRNPWKAVEEISRVLKSEGRFVGTVAFLEDFHGQSYYHHSENGTRATLEEGGLDVKVVEPYDNLPEHHWLRWDGMVPMARGLFPESPQTLRFALVAPLYALHRLWYILGEQVTEDEKASEEYRRKKLAGQFMFVADKSHT